MVLQIVHQPDITIICTEPETHRSTHGIMHTGTLGSRHSILLYKVGLL